MSSRHVRIYEDPYTHQFEVQAANGRVIEAFRSHHHATLFAGVNGLLVTNPDRPRRPRVS